MLMTPPRTERPEAWNGRPVSPPVSPLRGKGKERDEETGMSQWDRIQADQENPFHERVASLRGLSQPASTLQSPSSSFSKPSATPESIQILLGDLTSTLPAYIAKLERKQVATEKSNEAKLKKIEDLERENVTYVFICLFPLQLDCSSFLVDANIIPQVAEQD